MATSAQAVLWVWLKAVQASSVHNWDKLPHSDHYTVQQQQVKKTV